MQLSAYVRTLLSILVLAVARHSVMAGDTVPLGSMFHYQVQLKQNGIPLTDTCHFRFGLWTNPDFPFGLIESADVNGVEVVNGLADMEVDFGFEAFDGTDRWLEVAVACPPPGTFFTYTTLEPRQHITATPYALQARGLFVNDAGDVGIGLHGSAQRMTVEKFSGLVGVNTKSPLARMHLVESSRSLTSDAIHDDDLIIEDADAVLGLYSGSSGSTGSTLSLKEFTGGAMTDNWSIWRGTGNGDSALHFSYGTNPEGPLNPDKMIIQPTGRVGIGESAPAANLHLRGDAALRVDDAIGAPVLATNSAGSVGVGTLTPNAKLHVSSNTGLIQGPVTNNDDILVESVDAVLGLYSDSTGAAGSAVSLKELHPLGPVTDHWAMYRETNATGSSLRFTYGTNANYASNPTILELSELSGAHIEGDLHVDGAVTATGTRTGYLSIPTVAFAMLRAQPCCFEPQYVPSLFDTDGLAVWHTSSFRPAGQSFRFGAPVQLPHDAQIVSFQVTIFDDAPDENITIRLVRNVLNTNSPTTVTSISSAGEPGEHVLQRVFGTPVVIDNSQFAYWLHAEWTSPGEDNGSIHLGPARIEYTAAFP